MSETDNVLAFRLPPAKGEQADSAHNRLDVTLDFKPDGAVSAVHMYGVKDTAKNRHTIAAKLEDAAILLRMEGEMLSPDPDRRWMMNITVFASGRIVSVWRHGAFDTLKSLRWLKRRLRDHQNEKRHAALVNIAFRLGERIRLWWRGA